MLKAEGIRLLSEQVINKIAAGEVVERPASVLKELIDNAIDAGADHMEVTVVGGGSRLVQVRDNGSGMSRDDALMSIERHATSKIRSVDDIEQIRTLGFRGEALAAIAAVSRFSIITRPADQDAGTDLTVHGGVVESVRDIGAPPGTCVAVRNLFYNVPARRKFLRSEQTELAHLRQCFLVQALAHPRLAMTLTVDERELYRLPLEATIEERITELFNPELFRSLRPVSYRDVDVSVSGYAGLPSVSRADRSEQYLFINGRPASAPVIGHALREGYQSHLSKGRHPVVFLFLDIDPTQVDVNVHPTKKEVRFRRPSRIRDGLIAAVDAALRGGEGGTPASGAAAAGALRPPAAPQPLVEIRDLPTLSPFPYPSPAESSQPANNRPLTSGAESGHGGAGPGAPGAAPWAWCRILGQVGGLYVVMETDEGLVLMDPQAAHERVVYEIYLRQIQGGAVVSQGLVVPETVAVSPEEGDCIRRHIDRLSALGFGISDFGGDTFLVDALPACLGASSGATALGALARTLDQGGGRSGRPVWLEEQVARASCLAAVQSTRALHLAEIERLVTDLALSEMPYTSPFGRPTLIFIGFRELDRKFGRAG